MPKKEIGNWVSSKELADQSVARVSALLITHFPILGIEQTTPFSDMDKKGIDLILFPEKNFSNLISRATLFAQVKSSEAGIDGFTSKGKKFFGNTGREWKEWGLICLNGQWADTSIIGDFTVQLMNLMDIMDRPDYISNFLQQMKPIVRESYTRMYAGGLIHQYRGDLLNWVAGKTVI